MAENQTHTSKTEPLARKPGDFWWDGTNLWFFPPNGGKVKVV